MADPGSCGENHHDRRPHQYSPCAKVRLQHDQAKTDNRDRQCRGQTCPKQHDLFLIVCQPARQEGDDTQLGKLARLNPERSQTKPAF